MTYIYRVRAVGSGWTGAPGLSTFYFRGSSPTGYSSAEALEAGKRVRAFFAALPAVITTANTWDVSESVDVIFDGDGSLVSGFGIATQSPVIGTGGVNQGPPVNMCVGQLLTSTVVRGRRVRGRTYVGPFTTGTTSATGTWATGVLSAVQNGLTALGTVITTPVTNVVWSRPTALASGVACDVTSYSTLADVCVLRSRRN